MKTKFIILIGVCFSIFAELGYAESLYKTWFPEFNLMNLTGKNGFFVNGVPGYDSGYPTGGGGDFNGDGISDMLIGAQPDGNTALFKVYVVFGSKNPWPVAFNLIDLNGNNGFVITGSLSNAGTNAGISVNNLGDVNGDGIDDIFIGAPHANGYIGQGFIVFGRMVWPSTINLSDLNGSNGFIINGNNLLDQCGQSGIGVGDVNKDGISDFIVGAPGVDNGVGQSYVFFGRKGTWPSVVKPTDLNGTNGFIINGISEHELSGWSVGGGMDFNGDNISDILTSAPGAYHGVGRVYLIFGSKKAWPTVINGTGLNGNNGVLINGIYASDLNGLGFFGFCASSGGDLNRDGFGDILISAPQVQNSTGQIYMMFGSNATWSAVFNVTNLNGTNGVIFMGIPNSRSGQFVSALGDVNGDKIDDFVVGASAANNNTGVSFVVFGSETVWPPIMQLSDLNESTGFLIYGSSNNGGYSVSKVGDVNGDGLNDILIGSQDDKNVGQSYVVFGFEGEGGYSLPIILIIEGICVGTGVATVLTGIGVYYYFDHEAVHQNVD